jgi:SAM-dependent methyltransferase
MLAPSRDQKQLIETIRKERGSDIQTWIHLFAMLAGESRLPTDSLDLLQEHQIVSNGHAINYYAKEISITAITEFKALAEELSAESSADVAIRCINLIIRRKSVLQCRDAHTEGGYYAAAEPEMDWQWNSLILPFIGSVDSTNVLELGPGHGRNSEKLSQSAAEIYLVDVNKTCIDACRARFGDVHNDCRFYYHVTNGDSLPFIPDSSITFIYSFDSMVHFDKTIVRAYLREFHRVMKPGATGFLHHSNYGAMRPNSDWAQNPGNRSDVSALLFAKYCAEFDLEVTDQRMHGLAEGRGIKDLDCVTLIRKPV